MLMDNWLHSNRAMHDANPYDVQGLSRTWCTPNTRVAILEQIQNWVQDSSSNSAQVFWLTGHAGSGKSTIAYTIACNFYEGKNMLKTLQASFFCSRQFEDTKAQKYIIPTLVHQLAYHSQNFAKSLFTADRNSVHKHLKQQMQGLLVDPWKESLKTCSPELPPYLIVIDALDEIEGKGGSEFLKELLETIENKNLKGLKFLVTSRPDYDIAMLCKSFSSDSVCRLQDIDEVQADTDIMTYLHSAFPKFRHSVEVEELKKKANGLFIYASTAVRYISSGRTLGEQYYLMRQLLDSSKYLESWDVSEAMMPINNLYHQILSEAFSIVKNLIPARWEILHNILCAEERISTSIAARLSSSTDVIDMKERADDLVRKLHAVLHIKDGKVFWYHASFPDFIFAQAQSSKIHLSHLGNSSSYTMDMSCDAASHHARLAHKCFDIMLKELHFNMCNLPSSFLNDNEVPNLKTCIQEQVSDVLQYACHHWEQHIVKAKFDKHKHIVYKIEEFLKIHVIFLIEIMNLFQESQNCHLMLQQVHEYIMKVIRVL